MTKEIQAARRHLTEMRALSESPRIIALAEKRLRAAEEAVRPPEVRQDSGPEPEPVVPTRQKPEPRKKRSARKN